MTENVENLILAHLKRFQTTLEGIQRELRELKTRQSETHSAVLGVRRDQIQDAEIVAHVQSQMDLLNVRLERIEHRLEING